MKRKKLKSLIQEASALKGSLYENIKQVDLLLTRLEELKDGEHGSPKKKSRNVRSADKLQC